jgi:hypothetical protein
MAEHCYTYNHAVTKEYLYPNRKIGTYTCKNKVSAIYF